MKFESINQKKFEDFNQQQVKDSTTITGGAYTTEHPTQSSKVDRYHTGIFGSGDQLDHAGWTENSVDHWA